MQYDLTDQEKNVLIAIISDEIQELKEYEHDPHIVLDPTVLPICISIYNKLNNTIHLHKTKPQP